MSYLIVDTYSRFWIGLNDIEEEGEFVWINTGRPLFLDNFTFWGEHQPNNINIDLEQNADCCTTQNDGLWFDDRCEELNPFICEISL